MDRRFLINYLFERLHTLSVLRNEILNCLVECDDPRYLQNFQLRLVSVISTIYSIIDDIEMLQILENPYENIHHGYPY